MKKPEITEKEFFDWAKHNWIEYAAWTNFSGYRLRFKRNMTGTYRVYLGKNILYEGLNFNSAAKAFNEG